jgi:hypothetical protein
MNMESLETELAHTFHNLTSISEMPDLDSIECLPDSEISNPKPEIVPLVQSINTLSDSVNPEIIDTLADSLLNPSVENVESLLDGSDVVTLDSLNPSVEHVESLLDGSEVVTLDTINHSVEHVESLHDCSEVVTLDSLNPSVEHVESLLDGSEVVTLNSLLNPSIENIISELNPEVNTLNSLLNPSIENVDFLLHSPNTSINTLNPKSLPIPTFKRPQLRIQLPTFTNKCLSDVVLSPTEIIERKKEKEKEKVKITDQDKSQKLAVLATLVLELYRMLTSSLLLLFVPQSCKGQLCSISDNLNWNPKHYQYNFCICVNFITLFTYTCLYYTELKRENRLIKYLDVNPEMPSSNESVENTLQNIALEKKLKILAIDKHYQRISYISIGMYVFNSIVSGVIIRRFYFGTQTTTSFITSLLFMFTKLLNVYQVSNTEEHIFYSGYMKTFVQFNDLDKTHKNPDNL